MGAGGPNRADAADRTLIAAVASGDEAAHARLFRVYHGRLAAFAQRVTGRGDLAEEVASDTLHVAWRRAADFEGRSMVSTWMHGIAYRLALRARARLGARGIEVEPDEGLAAAEDGLAAVEALLERRRLARAMAQLSPEHRRVIELTYLEGASCEEAAAALGCPVGTVKTRMMHARARLRRLLETPSDGDARAGRAGRPATEDGA